MDIVLIPKYVRLSVDRAYTVYILMPSSGKYRINVSFCHTQITKDIQCRSKDDLM